jgi:hypothetical protein
MWWSMSSTCPSYWLTQHGWTVANISKRRLKTQAMSYKANAESFVSKNLLHSHS